MNPDWRRLLCLLVVVTAAPGVRVSVAHAAEATQAAPAAAEQIAVGNTARQLGGTDWSWSIFVMGDEATLEQIRGVTYLLHPTFTQRVQEMCTRGSIPGKGFTLSARGWGTFAVGVTVDFTDGRRQLLTHDLRFTANVEGWGIVNPSTLAPVSIPVSGVELDQGHFVFIVGSRCNHQSVAEPARESISNQLRPWIR